MTILRALFPALLCGVLFAAAFPPVGQWWLAWLWALPLFWKVWQPEQRRGWRQFCYGAGHGWLAGFFCFTGTLWWAGHVTVPGMIALCVYLALYPAAWGGVAALLRPHTPGRGLLAVLALALLWCGLEWARGILLTGFPWNGAATPLVEMPGLRSLAAYAGVTGLSVLPLLFMGGIAAAWLLRQHRDARGRAILLSVSLATPAVVTLITWQKTPQPSGTVQVMLVQPNTPRDEPAGAGALDERRMLEEEDGRDAARRAHLQALTLQGMAAARVKPALIVWPESSLPQVFHDRGNFALFEALFAAGADTFVVGGDARVSTGADDGDWTTRNCAILLRGSVNSAELHAKVHLVPFGEFLPLRKQLPILDDWLGHLIPGDFTPGTSLEPLRMEGLTYEVMPLICFEDTIAGVARQFVRDVPQLMVNVTNDNWFHGSNQSAMHALNARWRCLELQRPMIRAANTGVTCVIDTEGRVTHELPRWQAGVLHASVPLPRGGITFYAAYGDIIPISAGVAGLLLAALLCSRRR